MIDIVGRELERDAIRWLLASVDRGPAVLDLLGEAGIGKTTVWQAGVDEARGRGFLVLHSRPTEPDAQLSNAGLADLLADVPLDDFPLLPAVQRHALDAALLRGSPGATPEPRAVAVGLLSVLDALAREGPVLLAVDDLHWLDAPTRQVVGFAVRRCRGPIAVLTARRPEPGVGAASWYPRDESLHQAVRLAPLSLGALHHVLRRELGRPLPRPLLARVAEASGGNPFFAIELARGLDGAALTGVIQLPSSLEAAMQERLTRLASEVLEVLRVAALLATPTVERLSAVIEDADTRALLAIAEEHGVVALAPDGGVRFTHPLLASAVQSRMTAPARRERHQRLSASSEDPEERARHLALAAVGADEDTVAALDAAAEAAARRGAPGAAAELLELAIALGAREADRLVRAAGYHVVSNNPTSAAELLATAIEALEPGPMRARALARLGMLRFDTDARSQASALLEQAIREAEGLPGERCSIRIDLSYLLFISGRIPEALREVDRAIEEAEAQDDRGLLAEALASAVVCRFLGGQGTDTDALERALALEDQERPTPVRRWPSTVAAQVYRWMHRLEEARASFMALRQRCLDSGAESDLWFISLGAVPAACWAGDTATARMLVDDMLERARIVESRHALGMARLFETQLLAWTGAIDDARRAGADAHAQLAGADLGTIGLELPAALGMAELAVGNVEAAAHYLAPAAEMAMTMGFREPAAAQFLPDAAEDLIALGRLDEALPVVELLESSGSHPDRPWAQAVGARCRSLLLAAQGRSDDALDACLHALTAHDQLPQLRYDRARTLLVLGALQRRRNQRIAAREALTEAADLFDAVGAAGWSANAHSAQERLGLSTGSGEALTATEERVAELAASGLTNREVAATLFVSPKTVDAHLTRIYRKLDIRSRAELGWHMAQRQPAAFSAEPGDAKK